MLAGAALCLFAATAAPVQAQATLYATDFERAPSGGESGGLKLFLDTTTNIHGQHGWTVEQGTAEIQTSGNGAGGGCCVALSSSPAGKAKLTLAAPSGTLPPRSFIDFCVKPVAVVMNTADEGTLSVDGAWFGFFRANTSATTAQLYLFDGDGSGTGLWVGTNVNITVDAGTGAAADWVRVVMRQDYSRQTWDLYTGAATAGAALSMRGGDFGFSLTPVNRTETYFAAGATTGSVHLDQIRILSTNPAFADSDGDGIPDTLDSQPTVDDRDSDADNDGISNLYEYVFASNSTDGDTLDYLAESRHGTNPTLTDTDGDGVSDSTEINQGTNPLNRNDSAFLPAQDALVDISLKLGARPGDSSTFSARLYETEGPGRPEILRYTLTHIQGQVVQSSFRCRAACNYVIRLTRVSGTATDYILESSVASTTSTAVPTRAVTIDDSAFQLCRLQSGTYGTAPSDALTGRHYCAIVGAPAAEIYYGPGLAQSTGDAGSFLMTQTSAGTATIKLVKNRCDISPVIRSGRYDVLATSTSANGREITYTIGLPGWGTNDWLRSLSGAVSPYLSEPTGGPSWLSETPGRGMVGFDSSGGGAGPGVTRIAQFETSASLNISTTYTGGGPGQGWTSDMSAMTSAEDENDQEASGGTCSAPVPEVPPATGASGNENTSFDDGSMLADTGGGGGCCGGGGGGGGGGGQQFPNQRSFSRADQARHTIRAGADVDSRASSISFAISIAEGRHLPVVDGRSLMLKARGGATTSAPDSQGRPTRLNMVGSTAPGAASAPTAAITFTYPTAAKITATVLSIAPNGTETATERYDYSNPTATSFQILRERADGTDVTRDVWSTSGTTLNGSEETTVRTHTHSLYSADGISVIGGLKSEITFRRASSQSPTRTVETKTWRFDSNLATFTVHVLHRKVTWKRYAFGERIIKEELFPIGGGTARVTDYTYYETAGNGYGQIKSSVSSPSTRWVYHQYDSQGRPTLTVQQYLGNAPALDGSGFPSPACQSENVCFAVEVVDANSRWEVVRIAGKETFRRKYTRAGNQVTALTQLAPGAGAAGYSSTATYHAPDAAWYLAGRPSSVTRSDGTATQCNWAANSVTILDGLINAQALTEGTSTTTLYHSGGRGVASRVTTEKRGAATHTVSSVSYATAFDPATDIQTRTATWLDGTKSQEVWHGTHQESSISRDGTLTEHFHDALGRADRTRVLAGGHLLEYRSVFDDAWRVVQSLQQPFNPASPNTRLAAARLREIRAYNGFGEVEQRQTLLPDGTFLPTDLSRDETSTPGRLKTIAIARPAGAPAPVTAHETYDETVSYADGRFKEQWRKLTAGAAAVKVREMEYGVWDDGTWDREIRYRTGTETAATAVEWVKRYYKMGRLVRVETPPASTSVSTANGNAFLGHDAHGRLTSRKDADGVTRLYAYNSLGEVEKEALDRNGDGAINEGGGYDRVVKTATLLTTRTEAGSTKETRRVTTTTLTGALATDIGTLAIAESAHDGSVSWSEGAGGTTKSVQSRTADAQGFTLTETSVRTGPTGAVTSSTDAQGYTSATLDTDGTFTYYYHDDWVRHWMTYDGRENTTEYTFAANDAVATINVPSAGPSGTDDTVRTFDHMGRVATEAKPGAAETVYSYDLAGRLIGQGGGHTYTTAYGYDLQGRMTALTTYKDTSNPAQMLATAQTTGWTYNPLGQVQAKTYPLADSDGDGTLDAAPGEVSYAYSSAGRLLLRNWARGHRTRYYYNPRSGELNYMDYRLAAAGPAHEYNGTNDTDTRDVSLHYDRAGNLLWVNEGTLTGVPQSAIGNINITGGSGSTVTLTLSTSGNQAWAANLNGTTSDYALWFSDDHLLDGDSGAAASATTNSMTGIRTLVNYSKGTLPNGTYDVEIESEVFTQSGFAPTFRYDHADLWPANLTKETWTGLPGIPTATFDRTYTLTGGQGQFAGTVLKEGALTRAATGWSRDAQGHIQTFTDGTAALATYTYEPGTGGLFDTITTPLPNASSLIADHTYEPRRDVLDVRENKLGTGGPVVSRYDYTVNSTGQRSAVYTTGTAFSAATGYFYAYDALGQVTGATHINTTELNRTYGYDAIGNRQNDRAGTSPMNIYNASPTNAYSKVWADADQDGVHDAGEPSETLKYDLDGNLIEDGGKKYAWDGANRLRRAWRKATTDLLLATYEYDYRSRRLRKTTTASAPQGALTTTYLYDAWNPIAEYESPDGTTHSLRRTRYWGLDISGTRQGAGGVSGLVTTREWTGTGTAVTTTNTAWYYYTYDGNGNVSEVLDSTGTITAHYEYDPFGNLTTATGPSTGTTAYRFSTKPQDRELGDAGGAGGLTGWYYYGYRYYDPVKGRWPSRDPIEEDGGINLYSYVYQDSVNSYDFLGLWHPDCPKVLERIYRKSAELQRKLANFDPVSDMQSHPIWRLGSKTVAGVEVPNKKTSPGGHGRAIKDLQRTLATDILWYTTYCTDPTGGDYRRIDYSLRENVRKVFRCTDGYNPGQERPVPLSPAEIDTMVRGAAIAAGLIIAAPVVLTEATVAGLVGLTAAAQ